mgnify:CR=1 FL=1
MATGEEQSSIRWSRGFFLEAVGLNERRGLSWDFSIVNCAELSGLSSSTTSHISRMTGVGEPQAGALYDRSCARPLPIQAGVRELGWCGVRWTPTAFEREPRRTCYFQSARGAVSAPHVAPLSGACVLGCFRVVF